VSDLPELVWSVTEAVGSVTLNRPDFHNAISRQMWRELPDVLQSMKKQGAKVVVFSGAGSSFASGADIGELEKLESYAGAREQWHAIRDCLNSVFNFELPTIAMVNGPCLGGGCLLALACDLRYAAESASFAIPTARLGIVLDDANIVRLLAAVGPLAAKEMLFTGATISSARALEIGLVNGVLNEVQLPQTVAKVAAQIAANAPISMREAKLSVNRALGAIASSPQDEEVVIGSYIAPEFRERLGKRGTSK